MYSKTAKIVNSTGLHARPASEFVLKAKEFSCSVSVRNLSVEGSQPVNAKSIVRILGEGMGQGTDIEISADGEGEQAAVEALEALVASGFGEK